METMLRISSGTNITYYIAGAPLVTARLNGPTAQYTRHGTSTCVDYKTGKAVGSVATSFPAFFKAKMTGSVLSIHHYYEAADGNSCPANFTTGTEGKSSLDDTFKIDITNRKCIFNYSCVVTKTGFNVSAPFPPVAVRGVCRVE
jgi:hypothetical protein